MTVNMTVFFKELIFWSIIGLLIPVPILAKEKFEKKKVDQEKIPSTIEIPPSGRVEMQFDGKMLLVYSAPGMPDSLSMNKDVAEEIFGDTATDLRSDGDRSKEKFIHIGRPVKLDELKTNGIKIGEPKGNQKYYKIKYQSAFPKLKLGSYNWFWPVYWEEKDAYTFPNVDAIAGPDAIPAKIVKYNLRNSQAGEQIYSFPLARPWNWWIAGTEQEINGQMIHFAFAPQFETSVAGASAAAHISQIHKGQFTDIRKNILIAYGVERPTRQVNLAVPITLGAINIASLLVRTEDFGSATTIPGNKPATEPEDKSAIIVTAQRKIPKAKLIVYVGADALYGCSSITYDKPAKQIHLSCIKTKI